MNIKEYEFKDTDISLSSKKNMDYSISFKVEYKCHVTIPNEYAYMFLTKGDVIALAKHFNLELALLKSLEQEFINSNQSCESILESRIVNLECDDE